jgi:hypothetical protein
MPSPFLNGTGSFFDLLEKRWERLTTQRRVASALVIVFLAGIALVEARRIPWLSAELVERLPSNHFEAILLPFTLLLLAEVISLVFAIAQSVAIAVGKQLEIMSLILIRQSFKELTYFPEPIVWDLTSSEVTRRVLYILSDASGALVIFALLVVYFNMQTHQPISRDPDDQSSFVGAKKTHRSGTAGKPRHHRDRGGLGMGFCRSRAFLFRDLLHDPDLRRCLDCADFATL